MVDVKEAIRSAAQFVEQISSARPEDLRVEEVDSTEDFWLITLSFILPASVIRGAIETSAERQFKIFSVRKTDGHVESMKIRQVG